MFSDCAFDAPLARVTAPDGRVLELFHDPDPPFPFGPDADSFGTLVWWHSRYTFGPPSPYATPDDFLRALAADPDAVALPVYLYDHGGLAVSTTPTGVFADPWDAGQLGWIWASGATIRAEFGAAPDARDRATALLRAEIDELNMVLRGAAYGFRAYREIRCSCCGAVTDRADETSCWGFIGTIYAGAVPDWAQDLLPAACDAAGLPQPL